MSCCTGAARAWGRRRGSEARPGARTDDEREPIPFSEEASDSDGVLFSPTTWAAVATPLSACGRPAAISGLSRWNSEKVIG